MWNNNGDCGCLWIILIIILLWCCCGNSGTSNSDCCCGNSGMNNCCCRHEHSHGSCGCVCGSERC